MTDSPHKAMQQMLINELDTEEYRRDLWVDTDGCVWYFDFDTQDWRTLSFVQDNDLVGYVNDGTDETPADEWPNAPFFRLLRGKRP